MTLGPKLKPDLRSEKMLAQLSHARHQRDRFRTGPLRKHFEERVQELEAELNEYARGTFLMVASEID